MPCAFFLRLQCSSSDKPDPVIVDICTEGGAAKLFVCVWELQNRDIAVYLTSATTRERGGHKNLVCAFRYSCLVGERTLEGAQTVFIAVFQHSTPSLSPHPSTTPEFNRLGFVSTFFSTPGTRRHSQKQTKPNRNLRSNSGGKSPKKKGADMSGGDVVCSGWLRKSPPEKKLRRYVSALYILICDVVLKQPVWPSASFLHPWTLFLCTVGGGDTHMCARPRLAEHFQWSSVAFPRVRRPKVREEVVVFLFSGNPLLGKVPRQFRFQLLVHSPPPHTSSEVTPESFA